MELQGLKPADLGALAPELTLVISAIVLSLLDLLMPSRVKRTVLGWLTVAALLVSVAFVVLRLDISQPEMLLGQSYRVDDFANLMKLVFLGGTALTVFMSLGSIRSDEIQHEGELYYLFLPATLGGMIMASSADLITLFVGLETLSITSYILAGFRKKDQLSNEGAFKYIVLGGISSAIILYGMSFLYGLSGSTQLSEIRQALNAGIDSYSALIYVAFFLLLAGFGFKIAAAPFHTWAPDVYQGAPLPVTAFLAVVSKAGAFAILYRMMYGVFYGLGEGSERYATLSGDVFTALAALAAIAMIAGNTIALRQTNVKRLMAYSGVANAGYLLVPIAAQFSLVHYSNFSEFYYYLVAYLFMNIGTFAVLTMIENTSGSTELKGFAGLYYRAPYTAVAMVLLILSLAGIPLTGGFFGKLFIMLGAIENHQYWLAAVMIVTSVISFYYYFGIIRQMFMRSNGEFGELRTTVPLTVTVWLCAVAGVLMGLFPHSIIGYVQRIFTLAIDLFT